MSFFSAKQIIRKTLPKAKGILGRMKKEPDGEARYALLSPTPLEDDGIERYKDEFDLALSHPSSKNIALSGPYGAGKSSVALTVGKREADKGRHWIRISLADFDGVSDDRSVEDEILSQLVYKVPSASMSKSRLKPLGDRPRPVDALLSVFAVLFGVDTAYLCFLIAGGEPLSLPFVSAEAILVVAAVVWCIAAGLIVYRELRTKSISRTLKRLKILNAEVELFDGDGDTALDKYMDDVVYILKSSELDVVVFEDIDRFDDLTVFEKLRRINDLANEGRGRTLRFLYLIKDSLFAKPHDRTKFFDFIIPVIPFIDPNNSVDLLKRKLSRGGLEVGDVFLYQLSSFVDDPRILTDICNESIHYRDFLFSGDEINKYSAERLVGIISYKVIFPEDYENLQKGRGYVRSLFAKKTKLIDRLIEDDNSRVEELNEEMRRIRETLQFNENELKLLYLSAARESRQSSAFQYADGDYESEPSDVFDNMRDCRGDDIKREIEKIEAGGTRYSARLKEARRASDAKSALCRTEIDALTKRASEYSRMTLAELIGNNSDNDGFFDLTADDLDRREDFSELGFDGIKVSRYFPLIRFLISQGWIDETYPRYMSNIYSDSVQPSDLEFINSVLGAGSPQREYRIVNPKAVSMHLDERVIARPSARNYTLLAGLIELENDELVEAMLAAVGHDSDGSFVAGYLASDSFNQSVFPLLDKHYVEWAGDITDDVSIADAIKSDAFRRAFSSDGLPMAIKEKARAVGECVSSFPGFLKAPILDPDLFARNLARVSYAPKDIDIASSDPNVLARVIDEGMYVPSATLVSRLFDWKRGERKPVPLTQLDDRLRFERDGVVRKRVLSDIEIFISTLIAGIEELLLDSQEAIAMVLGAEGLSVPTGTAYIGRLANRISDLRIVANDDFAQAALEKNKVAPKTSNLIDAFARFGFSPCMLSYVAECGEFETDVSLEGDDADLKETARDLFEDSMLTADVDSETVGRIARSLNASFSNITLLEKNEAKVKMAIEHHALGVSEQNLASLRASYPGLVVQFAMCNLRAYVDLVCGAEGEAAILSVVPAEATGLFAEPEADLDLKIRIAEALDDGVPVASSYPDEVNIRLIELDRYDSYESLVELYESGGELLKKAVEGEVESHPDEFSELRMPDTLETHLLKSVIAKSRGERLDVVAGRIRALCGEGDRERVRSILKIAELDNYVALIDGPSAMIEFTAEDDRLLEVLCDLGMRGSVSPDVNDEGKRRVSSLGYHRKKFKSKD